jgi:SAM-dependent methyltransferase
MNREYYREYYSLERNHWWFKIREKIIFQRILSYSNGLRTLKILNIGAATGRSSKMLKFFGDVTSLEYDKECCSFVREKLNMKIIHGSVTNLPFDPDSFDLVCAFDVIEHVKNENLAISEMKRVCSKNGILCVTVPAYMSLWSEHDIVNKHYRRYTASTLSNLFKVNNLNELYLSYFNFFLFIPILLFRKLTKILPTSWIRKGSGSDFEIKNQSRLVNFVLAKIFGLEIILLRFLKFPFGVSIISLWKK